MVSKHHLPLRILSHRSSYRDWLLAALCLSSHANNPSVTYISQVFDFIDDLAGLSCLVNQADTHTYQLYNKQTGLKRSMCSFFHQQAQQARKESCWKHEGNGGVGLEHRCVQGDIVEVSYYGNPVSMFVQTSQD